MVPDSFRAVTGQLKSRLLTALATLKRVKLLQRQRNISGTAVHAPAYSFRFAPLWCQPAACACIATGIHGFLLGGDCHRPGTTFPAYPGVHGPGKGRRGMAWIFVQAN